MSERKPPCTGLATIAAALAPARARCGECVTRATLRSIRTARHPPGRRRQGGHRPRASRSPRASTCGRRSREKRPGMATTALVVRSTHLGRRAPEPAALAERDARPCGAPRKWVSAAPGAELSDANAETVHTLLILGTAPLAWRRVGPILAPFVTGSVPAMVPVVLPAGYGCKGIDASQARAGAARRDTSKLTHREARAAFEACSADSCGERSWRRRLKRHARQRMPVGDLLPPGPPACSPPPAKGVWSASANLHACLRSVARY